MDLFHSVQELAQETIVIDKIAVSLTVSGGVSKYPDDGGDSDELYRNVRIAYIESKRRGKRQITICSPSLCNQVQRRMLLLDSLRESVSNDFAGFSLRFQPLIQTKDETLFGCEALLRWEHPSFPDGVTPYEFIPVLEESGLIFEVNKWLLKNALLQCEEWVQIMPSFHMNLNISCFQFEDVEFKFLITKMIARKNLPASAITLELTETGRVSDMALINSVFNFLRSQGIKIALDDFGVGYSSLSVFQMLKVDQLKIDKSFLQRLTYDVTDQALVRQLIQLCHSMNIMVCVEGIESAQVNDIVKQFGPELLQGFYYDRPLKSEDFHARYFANMTKDKPTVYKNSIEYEQSLTYSALKPTQPLSTDVIVNNAFGGIFQVALDENFSFITCNEGYRRMLGYTPQDIEVRFNNRALGIVYPEDAEYVNTEIRRQLGEGDTVTAEFRVVRSDGKPIWVMGTGNIVKAADGNPSIIVIIVDVDDLKKKQLSIEKEYKKYKRILQNIPVGVKCVQNNEDFDLDYMSPAFLSLLGYDEKDLEKMFNRKYINMVQEEDRPIIVSDVLEQVKTSNIVTLRYRSPCKDGHPIWVETISKLYPPEEDGIQRWYSSVVNITDTITDEQKDHAKDFAIRIQNASQQWGDVMFEYHFASDRIIFSENYKDLFGRNPQDDMLSETASIFPEDRQELDKAIQLMHQGIQPPLIEVRYYSEDRGYFWVSILFTEPDALAGNSVSVIGRITDIDEAKKTKEELLIQSKTDGLTGILNKKSIEEEIRQSIENHKNDNSIYALCILDIDDFKGLNDTKGHVVGDYVLKEISRRLAQLSNDHVLIGRAGGDEFMIYAKLGYEFKSSDFFGRTITELLCEPISCDGEMVSISTSAGISLFPSDSQDFYNLYRLADSALYLVKAKGKANYHVTTSI
ncbi:EAL domain-containing protein [Amedibacillus sp. YH-ame6]